LVVSQPGRHQPPVVSDDGENKNPGDRHHCIKAPVLADQEILYEVRSGTLIDAIRYSCGANHIINRALRQSLNEYS